MVMDVEIKQVICKVLFKHQICKVSIPSLLSLSPLFLVRKHMPDREKLMQTCYTPSHGGENTSLGPQSPSSTCSRKKQRQKWLAEPNTVLLMCFTSISSPVKRQNTLKFCFPLAHFWSLTYLGGESFWTHSPLPLPKIRFPFFHSWEKRQFTAFRWGNMEIAIQWATCSSSHCVHNLTAGKWWP